MPRGFDDIASGSALSAKLQAIAVTFLEGLRVLSETGKVTAEHPMTNAEIRKRFAATGVKLSGDEIRALVNYHRRRDERIISTNKGYFMTNSWKEAEPWVKSLKDRLIAQHEAYMGLLRGFGMKEGQIQLFKEQV
jgi:hypothetical protein